MEQSFFFFFSLLAPLSLLPSPPIFHPQGRGPGGFFSAVLDMNTFMHVTLLLFLGGFFFPTLSGF